MKKVLISLILMISFSALSFSQSHLFKIPQDYSTIQAGINKAVSGDTVLVAPGTYFENINFRGKNIVVASNYIIDHDLNNIGKTIIDGSKKPLYPDTSSCVIFASCEDSTSVLEGFTITNGKGTIVYYTDDKLYFRQGGGIVIHKSSPTIKNNIIVNNGYTSTTVFFNGGGIGVNDHSNPRILNNIIQFNQGPFGSGIAIWDSSHVTLKNNIIRYNSGGNIFGGAGVGIDRSNTIIENNTIVFNTSFGTGDPGSASGLGGGIVFWSQNPEPGRILKNNIIWGNKQVAGGQIAFVSTTADIIYNDIEGGYTGTGNIDKDPLLTGLNNLLSNNSPSIDAGDAATTYNDPENALNIGFAKLPAKGGLRNDMGAYGGPGSGIFPDFSFSSIDVTNSFSFGNGKVVGKAQKGNVILSNQSTDKRVIDSVVVRLHKTNLKIISNPTDSLNPMQCDTIKIEWTPSDANQFVDTILIYHNTMNTVNPIKVVVKGTANNPVNIEGNKVEKYIKNFPNPVYNVTSINYSIPENSASLLVYNITGQAIKKYEGLKGIGSVQFDGSNLPSGIYLYKLCLADRKEITGKMAILK